MGNYPWLVLLGILSAAFLFQRKARKSLPQLTLAVIMLAVLGTFTIGCGSRNPDKNADPTYPGTYTYTVTATDGTLTHAATYTLTVAIRD